MGYILKKYVQDWSPVSSVVVVGQLCERTKVAFEFSNAELWDSPKDILVV